MALGIVMRIAIVILVIMGLIIIKESVSDFSIDGNYSRGLLGVLLGMSVILLVIVIINGLT